MLLVDYVSNGIISKWHKNEKFPKWHKFRATVALEKSRTNVNNVRKLVNLSIEMLIDILSLKACRTFYQKQEA